MTEWLQPVRLAGVYATLEPLSLEQLPGLTEAAQDGELWKLWYTAIPSPAGMQAEIQRRLDLQARGAMLPFATRNAAGKLVGMTTYMNVDAVHQRVEIGSTWTARSAQRGPLNTECKLMLLTHAFET